MIIKIIIMKKSDDGDADADEHVNSDDDVIG